MPRKKPEETLYPYALRLTRQQIAKVKSLGGSEWVRALIQKTHAAKSGRNPKEFSKYIRERNDIIGMSDKPVKELCEEFHLHNTQVYAIRRKYAVDRDVDKHVQKSNL